MGWILSSRLQLDYGASRHESTTQKAFEEEKAALKAEREEIESNKAEIDIEQGRITDEKLRTSSMQSWVKHEMIEISNEKT